MRALGPFFVVSIALWASLAWCFFVICTATGRGRIHLSAHDLGIFLIYIDAAFAAAIIWHDWIKSRNG